MKTENDALVGGEGKAARAVDESKHNWFNCTKVPVISLKILRREIPRGSPGDKNHMKPEATKGKREINLETEPKIAFISHTFAEREKFGRVGKSINLGDFGVICGIIN